MLDTTYFFLLTILFLCCPATYVAFRYPIFIPFWFEIPIVYACRVRGEPKVNVHRWTIPVISWLDGLWMVNAIGLEILTNKTLGRGMLQW